MNTKYLFPILAVLASAVLAQSVPQGVTPSTQKSNSQTLAQASRQHEQEEGARIFQQNCSRCHNAPEGFSPSISGTIVMHMRVRASLSKHDQDELLRFLNP